MAALLPHGRASLLNRTAKPLSFVSRVDGRARRRAEQRLGGRQGLGDLREEVLHVLDVPHVAPRGRGLLPHRAREHPRLHVPR
eukprot:CAMPEP_0171634584 /NCGR_PEP_ID=MMETSP0990-20121206/26025_1 /TAXON_ID=483369 /ORGANISM="non described non described, Strain CCMP2098" /LENGTH=82 /DNA_ID=CAMNT_0012205799 /DNA_START=154 /DNA_END=399 /DNA_ORIENTATION=-